MHANRTLVRRGLGKCTLFKKFDKIINELVIMVIMVVLVMKAERCPHITCIFSQLSCFQQGLISAFPNYWFTTE